MGGGNRISSELEKLLSPIVLEMGYVFVGLEYFPQGKHSLLRVYITKPTSGVTADDCAEVSRQVGALLEVENVIRGEYTLEVSSPGLDQRLFTVVQCQAQVGKLVSIRLAVPKAGRRNFKGRLLQVRDNLLGVDVDGAELAFDFADISEVRLVPEW